VNVVCAALGSGKSFKAFIDLVNTPTWIDDLFKMMLRIIDGQLTGLFHLAGCDVVSRYEFALQVAQVFGLDSKLVFPEKLPLVDIRPKHLSINSLRTYQRLGVSATPLVNCLEKCRERLDSLLPVRPAIDCLPAEQGIACPW
jgi:dTDP-4-dehydrorhamnose reductase